MGDEGSCRTSRASREAHEGQGHEGQGHEGQEGRQEEVRCRAVCVPVTRAAMASLAISLYNSRNFKEALKASSRVPCGLGCQDVCSLVPPACLRRSKSSVNNWSAWPF